MTKVGCKYLPLHADIVWDFRGLITKTRNGLCVPMLQQYFLDASFSNFNIISFGGDNVFIYWS